MSKYVYVPASLYAKRRQLSRMSEYSLFVTEQAYIVSASDSEV